MKAEYTRPSLRPRAPGELRRIAKQAGFLPGLDACAVEASLLKVAEQISRCQQIKAGLRWVLHMNTLAAICATIFALYEYKFVLPYGLECAAIGFIFVVAVKYLEYVDELHASLIQECNTLTEELYALDTQIVAWFRSRNSLW